VKEARKNLPYKRNMNRRSTEISTTTAIIIIIM
jgi:hypothetical protein